MVGNLYISPESKRWKTSKRLATAMEHFQTGSITSGHGGRQHAAQVPRLKRSHKKSRQGCLTCKQRRVKCDERRPSCRNCSHRRIACGYATRSSNALPRDRSESSTPLDIAATLAAGDVRVSSKDLLHHYLHHTSITFGAFSAHSQQFWATVVPAVAYSSLPVRLGMLTASALCLSHDTQISDPGRSLDCLQAAEHYGQEFVRTSSQCLRALDHGDAVEHLACSRLLTVLGLAWYRIYREHCAFRLLDERSWTWLHLLRGTATLYHRCGSTSGKLVETLANELADGGSPWSSPGGCRLEPGYQYYASTLEARFTALYKAVVSRSPSLDPHRVAHISFAIDSLREIAEEIRVGPELSILRSLCFWPCSVSKEFVDMLTQGNLLALARYAHWLMAMVLVEGPWYIGDMGSWGILEITSLCDTAEDATMERALLVWPLQMIEETHGITELRKSDAQ